MSSPRPAGVTIKTLFLLNMQLPVAHNTWLGKEKGVAGGDRLFIYIKLLSELLVHIPWCMDISFYVSFNGQKSMLNSVTLCFPSTIWQVICYYISLFILNPIVFISFQVFLTYYLNPWNVERFSTSVNVILVSATFFKNAVGLYYGVPYCMLLWDQNCLL